MKSLLSGNQVQMSSDEESSSDEDENDSLNVQKLIKKATHIHDDESEDEDIQLSDLISATTKHSDDTRVSADKTQKELQNIEELKKIDKQFKKGAGLFYALEDTEIQGEERRAAFDIVDEGMEKWHTVVENVENARHVPIIYKHLRDKTEKEKILEKGIKGSGVFDDTNEVEMLKSFEATKKQLSNMDKEALLARHKEVLNKRREMEKLARKNKWLKNIKSKTYRRILKKQKEKQKELIEEEEMKNMDEEELKQKIMKREREMITERLTMRHKNTSKWVRHAMKHQSHNDDLRQSVADQLQIHTELIKKQTKKEENQSDEEEEVIEEIFKKERESNPFEMMRQTIAGEENKEAKGLFGMKFMKKAEDKKKLEQMDLVNQMERDVEIHLGKNVTDSEEASGRMQFSKTSKGSKKQENDSSSGEEDNSIESKFEKNSFVIPKSTLKVSSNQTSVASNNVPQTTVLNTTKIESKTFGQTPLQNSEEVATTSISMKRKRTSVKENPWLNKAGKTKSRDSDDITDTVNKKKKKLNKDIATKILIDTDDTKIGIDSSNNNEQEESEAVVSTSKKNREQMEFEKKVKQEAFAGDDLELQFAEEKDRAIDEEIDMPDLSTTFKPGWGSWAGFGKEEQVKRDLEKKKRQIGRLQKKIREQKIDERSDSNLNHVIIRETAKIPDKFLIPVHNQVEAAVIDGAFAHPLGMEWNTLKGHKTQIAPRVNLQSGQIAKALDYETMQIKSTKTPNDPLLDVKQASKIESAKEQRYQKLKDRLKDDYETVKQKRQEAREATDKEKEESRKRYNARWEKDSDEE